MWTVAYRWTCGPRRALLELQYHGFIRKRTPSILARTGVGDYIRKLFISVIVYHTWIPVSETSNFLHSAHSTIDRKLQRHRAVSLRQHGFLVQ